MTTLSLFEYTLKQIGTRLHTIRMEKQQKQLVVAKAVSISVATLSKIESGSYKQVSLKKLHDLAQYYDISVANILFSSIV